VVLEIIAQPTVGNYRTSSPEITCWVPLPSLQFKYISNIDKYKTSPKKSWISNMETAMLLYFHSIACYQFHPSYALDKSVC
jgi:hypothetical protein